MTSRGENDGNRCVQVSTGINRRIGVLIEVLGIYRYVHCRGDSGRQVCT